MLATTIAGIQTEHKREENRMQLAERLPQLSRLNRAVHADTLEKH
jgi:hypothetical protein